MAITENIKKLRERLNEYRTQNFPLNKVFVHDSCSIEIALSLAELGVVRKRPISEEEEHWFKGKRYINDSFGSLQGWSDVYNLYLDLVEEVNAENYFRE